MPIFVLALVILALLLANANRGGSNQGCLAQLGLWFAVGVLLVPLLVVASCFCRPG